MRLGIAYHLGRAVAVAASVLAGLARDRGWDVHFYKARDVETQAAHILGERADDVIHGPRATLGPP